MILKLYNRLFFDIILSVFFFFQILGINWSSGLLEWILNISSLLFVLILIIPKLNVPFKNMWMFHVFLIFWVFTDLIVMIIDIYNFGFIHLALGNLAVISFQLPVLAIILYYFLCNYKSFKIFAFFSFIITIALYVFWFVEIIESFKYQIIGNFALFSIILFQNINFSKHKKINFLLNILLIIVVLTVGSRQSLLGLIILGLILILISAKKYFFKIVIFVTVFSSFLFFIINSSENIYNSFEEFNTISRFIDNASLESSSNSYRIESANMLIENFSYLPNGYGYTQDYYFLEPHNLFLEIIYLKGYILGGFIVSILILLILNSILHIKSKVISFLIIVLLVPALVSYTLHAARFFMIGILVLLITKSFSNFNNKKYIF